MERTCEDLIKYINDVILLAGLDDLSEHVISNCVNRPGCSIKNRDLEFDAELQKMWSEPRDTLWYELDLSSIRMRCPRCAHSLFATIELKLA